MPPDEPPGFAGALRFAPVPGSAKMGGVAALHGVRLPALKGGQAQIKRMYVRS